MGVGSGSGGRGGREETTLKSKINFPSPPFDRDNVSAEMRPLPLCRLSQHRFRYETHVAWAGKGVLKPHCPGSSARQPPATRCPRGVAAGRCTALLAAATHPPAGAAHPPQPCPPGLLRLRRPRQACSLTFDTSSAGPNAAGEHSERLGDGPTPQHAAATRPNLPTPTPLRSTDGG